MLLHAARTPRKRRNRGAAEGLYRACPQTRWEDRGGLSDRAEDREAACTLCVHRARVCLSGSWLRGGCTALTNAPDISLCDRGIGEIRKEASTLRSRRPIAVHNRARRS